MAIVAHRRKWYNVSGSNHVYTLNGTRIVSEAWGNFLLFYLYDESGSPIGL